MDNARAESIALEHAAWCRKNGQSWDEIRTSIKAQCEPTMDAVVRALALAWINLDVHEKRARAERWAKTKARKTA